ncbi:hypothetical protein RHSIM_Rhsim02G0235300 [Rhododendron simsii]|uniref:HMA domain-containing protein n=1 Tax=Rhododendron simsii TaxID=118357 RepID=A0A834LRN9_RHOSS|nr:hypothetical protein RHSIM_Rhsim02G0235300 [Rhododendron simsii]
MRVLDKAPEVNFPWWRFLTVISHNILPLKALGSDGLDGGQRVKVCLCWCSEDAFISKEPKVPTDFVSPLTSEIIQVENPEKFLSSALFFSNMLKIELQLEVHDDKGKRKAMNAVSSLPGIESIAMNMKDRKLTVIGDVDPVDIVSKLQKCHDLFQVARAPTPLLHRRHGLDRRRQWAFFDRLVGTKIGVLIEPDSCGRRLL